MESKLYLRRKMLGLTQSDIAALTGVSDRTIRNLEYKNTQTSYDTINALTLGYKLSPQDLYRIHSYCDLEDDLTKLDQKIVNKYSELTSSEILDFIDELKERISNLEETSFEYCYCSQHLYFLMGLIEYYSLNFTQAFDYYIKALRFTLVDFSMKKISFYLDYIPVLSRLEIRIIYNLASISHNLGQADLSLNMINALVEKVDRNWTFYCEILSHKAISEYRNGNHEVALVYINKALDQAQKLYHFKNLPLYYYNHAAIKIKLKDPSLERDKDIALSLCDYMGLASVKNQILNKIANWD